MRKIKVFLDSDVVISSLISTTGAAAQLFQIEDLERILSDVSAQELNLVATKLGLKKERLTNLIDNKCQVIKLKKISKGNYTEYTTDLDDAHIVAGVKKSQAKFLISYNIKHFKTEKIKQDFNIIVTTPAKFLQYLRSL